MNGPGARGRQETEKPRKETLVNPRPRGGGVTAPAGFTANGISAGIRKSGKKDLAVLIAHKPAAAAAVYTANTARAAPLQITREHMAASGGRMRAVVVNSGVANACTGPRGIEDARSTARAAAEYLGIPPEEVAVASTGVIGTFLPMDELLAGLPRCLEDASVTGHGEAAEAIMTTDTFPKEGAVRCRLSDGTEITIGAMAKGAGMIHPNMATMLCFATTDASITPAALQTALTDAVAATFNMISVDGDTSTNDMVLAMAGGAAGGPLIEGAGPDLAAFTAALKDLFTGLARDIARDGEGAEHLLTVTVRGADSLENARRAAKAVISSSLVKTALFGEDPNWGRIAAALGNSRAPFDLDALDISIGGIDVLKRGIPVEHGDEETAALNKALAMDEVEYDINLNGGPWEATAWGCDLTHAYVELNSAYRT